MRKRVATKIRLGGDTRIAAVSPQVTRPVHSLQPVFPPRARWPSLRRLAAALTQRRPDLSVFGERAVAVFAAMALWDALRGLFWADLYPFYLRYVLWSARRGAERRAGEF